MLTYTGTGQALYIEDAANDTTPFVIDANGNLGIGTSTPGSILAVGRQGESVGGYFFTNIGLCIGTSTPGGAFAIATTTAGANTAFLLSNLGTGYTAWLEDAANDTTPFVIDASGNLGIGTSTPGSILAIGRQGESVGGYFFTNVGFGIGTSTPGSTLAIATTTTGTQTAFLISNLGSGSTAWFEDAANDTSPFTIDAAGNVGVGTTTPGTIFGIDAVASFASGTSTISTALRAASIGVTSTTATTTISTGGFQVGQAGASAAFTVGQSATTSVGVGTSTPSTHQFGVTGNALIGGTVGTTTLAISSATAGVGGCIEMRAASSSTMFRIYLGNKGPDGNNTTGLMIEPGTCR